MKAILVKLERPEDVLKIQDILAEAFRNDEIQDLHGVGCACGGKGCDKNVVVSHFPKHSSICIMRGAAVIDGIILDKEGIKRLVEQLGGKMEV